MSSMAQHLGEISAEGDSDNFASAQAGPEIHIVIDSQGSIVLETVGTTGAQCDLLAGALESCLGVVAARSNKETYANG